MQKQYHYQDINWVRYIERRNSLFYVCIFIEAYSSGLRKALGVSYKNQLHLYKDGVFTFYRSRSERTAVQANIIRNLMQPRKVAALLVVCAKYQHKEQELVKRFSQPSKSRSLSEQYNQLIRDLTHIFCYLTVIHMEVLDAASDARNFTKQDFLPTANKFLPFRRTSRNILQGKVLEKLWRYTVTRHTSQRWRDFSFYTPEEFGRLLRQGVMVSKSVLLRRKRGCIFYLDPQTGKINFTYNRRYIERLAKPMSKAGGSLFGTIACGGFVAGRVCVVNKPSDMKKFKKKTLLFL